MNKCIHCGKLPELMQVSTRTGPQCFYRCPCNPFSSIIMRYSQDVALDDWNRNNPEGERQQ